MLPMTFLFLTLISAVTAQSIPPTGISVAASQPPSSVPSTAPIPDASGNLTGNVKNFRGCSANQKYDLQTAFRDATEIAKAALPVDVNDYVIPQSPMIIEEGADLEFISSFKTSSDHPNTLRNTSKGFRTT